MNRVLFLIVVALVTLGIVFWVKKPEVIENIYLWLIGFAGVIIRLLQEVSEKITDLFNKDKDSKKPVEKEAA